jgi:hypothetical protein
MENTELIMNIAKLVLEYLKVLIWPAFVLIILFRYRSYLDRFLERFSEETEEFSSKFLGITAKFRRDLEQIKDQLPADDVQAKEVLENKLKELAKTQIKDLSSDFMNQSLTARKVAANAVESLSKDLSVDDLLELSSSRNAGERVSAGIAFKVQLDQNPQLIENEKVRQAISGGLTDPYSRVRYRYVQALLKNREFVSQFHEDLNDIASHDSNGEVRRLARRIVRRF